MEEVIVPGLVLTVFFAVVRTVYHVGSGPCVCDPFCRCLPGLFSLDSLPTARTTLGVAVPVGGSRERSFVYSPVDDVFWRFLWYWVRVLFSWCDARLVSGLFSPGPPLWLLLRFIPGGAHWRSCSRGFLFRGVPSVLDLLRMAFGRHRDRESGGSVRMRRI